MNAERNIHGTAVAVGDKGYLFVGPSGSGKTSTALAMLAAAQRGSGFAAMIADDQVIVSGRNGRIVARCPDTIRGLAEVRGSDIVRVPVLGRAVLHFAIRLVGADNADRLAPEGARFEIDGIGDLPLLHLRYPAAEPLFLIEHLAEAYGNDAKRLRG